jgi:hypothetical protein
MKYVSLLLFAATFTLPSFAQRTIQMRNLWTRPQVHVLFQGYIVSFTIKDINRAMELLLETGDSTFGTTCGLDTAGNYIVELYPGLHQEYHNRTQALMQRGVGAFLLTAGHAYIENTALKKHKKIPAIIADIKPLLDGMDVTTVKFYDPATSTLLFDGIIPAAMYNRDLGIDY